MSPSNEEWMKEEKEAELLKLKEEAKANKLTFVNRYLDHIKGIITEEEFNSFKKEALLHKCEIDKQIQDLLKSQ